MGKTETPWGDSIKFPWEWKQWRIQNFGIEKRKGRGLGLEAQKFYTKMMHFCAKFLLVLRCTQSIGIAAGAPFREGEMERSTDTQEFIMFFSSNWHL